MKNVLVRLASGREMLYPVDAVKVNSRGGLYVAVSLMCCESCVLVDFVEAF